MEARDGQRTGEEAGAGDLLGVRLVMQTGRIEWWKAGTQR